MISLESWLAFSTIALIATLTPGPAVLLVSTHSLRHGVARAMITVMGNISGLLTMSACSVLGLSTLLLYSSTAFTLVKLIGALYLVYLGIKLWRHGVMPAATALNDAPPTSGGSLYLQGLLIALTNPKAIIFTTALFPQFIQPSQPLLPQFVLLVATFMGFSLLCLGGYALLARQAQRGATPILSGRWIGRVFGSAFIGAGAALATARP